MMVYGYCRIRTKQQSIERQVRNILAEYPKAKLYKEAFTGTKLDRPDFKKLLDSAVPEYFLSSKNLVLDFQTGLHSSESFSFLYL